MVSYIHVGWLALSIQVLFTCKLVLNTIRNFLTFRFLRKILNAKINHIYPKDLADHTIRIFRHPSFLFLMLELTFIQILSLWIELSDLSLTHYLVVIFWQNVLHKSPNDLPIIVLFWVDTFPSWLWLFEVPILDVWSSCNSYLYHKVHLTLNQKYFNIEFFPIFYILYLYYCNCVKIFLEQRAPKVTKIFLSP